MKSNETMTKIYNCPRCGYESSQKQNMRTHLLRKKQCKPLVSDMELSPEVQQQIFECFPFEKKNTTTTTCL